MTDEKYDLNTIKQAFSFVLPEKNISEQFWFQIKESLNEVKSNITDNDRIYDDILDGKYDDWGFKIHRVFRDEYGKIMKCTYISDGVFKEVDLNMLLTGNAFKPKEDWRKTPKKNRFVLIYEHSEQ